MTLGIAWKVQVTGYLKLPHHLERYCASANGLISLGRPLLLLQDSNAVIRPIARPYFC